MDAGITPEQFELLLPLACQWAAAQEQRICSHGQALSDAQLADATQLISALTGGLTLRYGIFIRSDCRFNRAMVVHELGHTAQYERLGGFESFLRQYLSQCLTIGYPEAPMEQEVISLAARICGSPE
ncbi:MAG: hypothetical protein DME91_00515 [Verrucomicrobia bacterium]|nr:MAG: hypothetical protein DME91_00515 [Verrucomicrobiota bacterium]